MIMWEVSNSLQLLNLLRSVVFGIIFCLFYDVLRSLRKVFNFSDFAVFFQDIAVSVILAITTFVFLLSITNGMLRMFVIVGMALGFLVSRLTISRLFFRVLTTLFSRLSVFFSGLFSKFYDGFEVFRKNIIKIFKKSGKTIKKLLKKVRGLWYTKWHRQYFGSYDNET